MSVNYTPTMEGYSGQGQFKFWVQNALPIVYDDSLSYYELLCKVVDTLNNAISDIDNVETNVESLLNAYNQLQSYVNNYFDNLDVQEEINNKLDEMISDGTLPQVMSIIVNSVIDDVVAEQIGDAVESQINDVVADQIGGVVSEQIGEPAAETTAEWLSEHVNPVGSAVVVDDTLTISGAAADSKATGLKVASIEDIIREFNVFDYLMPFRWSAADSSRTGIYYTWSGGKCTVSGTSTAANSFGNIGTPTLAQIGFEVGKTYRIHYQATNVRLQIFSVDASSAATAIISTLQDVNVTIPNDCRSLIIRFNVVASGTTVNETVVAYITDADSLPALSQIVDNCYKSWTPTLDANNKFNLDDMPLNTVAFIQAAWIKDEEAEGLNKDKYSTAYLEKVGRDTFSVYRFTPNAMGGCYYGFKISGVYTWRGTPNIYPVNIGLIGDSVIWGRVGGASGVVQAEEGIPYYVALGTGKPTDNLGVGSMGWASKQYLDYTVEDYIRTIDLTKYQTIAIMLGANDGMAVLGSYTDTTQNTIMGAVYRTIEYIMSQNPYCRVVLINDVIGKGSEFPYYNPDSTHYTGWTWEQFYEQMRLFGKKYAIPVIEAWQALNAWNRRLMIGDNIHPNLVGYKFIGTFISGQLKALM